ncbi:hypothetical protein OROGR_034142 [Orobanche gracilis]
MELEVFPELERLEVEKLKRLDRGARRNMRSPMILGFQWGLKGCSFDEGWPTRKGYPWETYNKNHMTDKLMNELRISWPNTHIGNTDHGFWEHEWNEHGRDSHFTRVEYFEAILDVLTKYKLSSGFPPDFVVCD